MNRTVAISTCLLAAGIGLQPWVSAALAPKAQPAEAAATERGDSQQDKPAKKAAKNKKRAKKNADKKAAGKKQRKPKRAERSYLQEWIERQARFGKSQSGNTPIDEQPEAPSDRTPPVADVEGSPSSDSPSTEGGQTDAPPAAPVTESDAEPEGSSTRHAPAADGASQAEPETDAGPMLLPPAMELPPVEAPEATLVESSAEAAANTPEPLPEPVELTPAEDSSSEPPSPSDPIAPQEDPPKGPTFDPLLMPPVELPPVEPMGAADGIGPVEASEVEAREIQAIEVEGHESDPASAAGPLFEPPTAPPLDIAAPPTGDVEVAEPTPLAPLFGPPAEAPAFELSEAELSPTVSEAATPRKQVEFPPLPPDPYAEDTPVLAPLCVELGHHGGSYLYAPEGDGFQQHAQETIRKEMEAECNASHAHAPHANGGIAHAGRHGLRAACETHIACEMAADHHHGHHHDQHGDHHHDAHHAPPKRLPEWFEPPLPCTQFPGLPRTEYLGADPIQLSDRAWPGPGGYQWEPRFVLAGRYDVFGIAFEENDRRQDLLGHNLTLDADLRLTGTERFHLQHRPIGEDGSGGSFYQFNDVDAYRDNSTAEPARVWFEGELASIFSGYLNDPTQAWDVNFAVGKFPLALHNNLLMNDEVAGVIVGQNNQRLGDTSNFNPRVFWLWDDINSLDDSFGSEVLGADLFIDYHHAFIEATYAYRKHSRTADGDAHYLAASGTKFFGPATATARAMVKIAGPAGSDGQLFVVEWNTHRTFDEGFLARSGVHHAVMYANVFYATDGWSPIAGANFNRLRSSFEVNPLVQIARGDRDDTPGVAAGVQLFGDGDDMSLTPEVAWEAPGGQSVFGAGMRYQRRTSVRSFLELRSLINFSRRSQLERNGFFASHHWLF